MMNSRTYIISFISALVLLSSASCTRKKEISSSPENLKTSQVIPYMTSKILDFEELKARMKIKADLNGDSKSFTADMRWMKNEKIWMSFSIFGIEGIRILIDPDSLQIMDRMNSEYYKKSLDYIYELAHIELDFEDIEQLLLGNLLSYSEKGTRLKKMDGHYVFKYDDKYMNTIAEISLEKYLLESLLIKHKFNDQNLTVRLNDYEKLSNSHFSMERDISASVDNNSLELHIKFLKIEPTKDLAYPFVVNPKYKRVE